MSETNIFPSSVLMRHSDFTQVGKDTSEVIWKSPVKHFFNPYQGFEVQLDKVYNYYCIAGKFDGQLNLAVWWLGLKPPN